MARSDKPTCYVASPLGFNDAGRSYYETVYLPRLREVVTLIDPWSQVKPAEVEAAGRGGSLRDFWLYVGQRNLDLIASAPLLVAWLDGQEVDSGTAVEVGYAAGIGRRCYGVRTDLRQAGEAEMAVNLQVEATIESTGGVIATSLDDLVRLLRTDPAVLGSS